MHSLQKLERDIDKQIGHIEDKQTKLAKQTSQIQHKLGMIDDCLRLKLEDGDLNPIRDLMQLFATKKTF